jgi:ribosomal protein S18 acetylase RimI-like enzyme
VIDVALRRVEDSDTEFLFRVYASTREEELEPTGWSAEQKALFLRHQFDAQDRYYHDVYTSTSFDVILVEGEPAGRLYVGRWTDEIRMVDIALLPPYRRMGAGTFLMRRLQHEARETQRALTLHVEVFNPAVAWYRHLGFAVVEDKGIHLFMRWNAAADT